MAVRVQKEDLIYTDKWLLIDEPTRISANYRDRSGVRAAGAIVLIATAVVVGVTIAAIANSDPRTDKGIPIVFGAALPGAIGTVVGVALIAVEDKVVIQTSKL